MTADGFLLLLLIVGDTWFQAQRRAWSQAASKAGVTNFGYLFTQPQPTSPAQSLGGKSSSRLWYPYPCSHASVLQVYHASEIFSVYGAPNDTSASATSLSNVMLDYWISFATILDPNDGYGNKRIISNPLFHFYRN